jgi:hypothetical protein
MEQKSFTSYAGKRYDQRRTRLSDLEHKNRFYPFIESEGLQLLYLYDG